MYTEIIDGWLVVQWTPKISLPINVDKFTKITFWLFNASNDLQFHWFEWYIGLDLRAWNTTTKPNKSNERTNELDTTTAGMWLIQINRIHELYIVSVVWWMVTVALNKNINVSPNYKRWYTMEGIIRSHRRTSEPFLKHHAMWPATHAVISSKQRQQQQQLQHQ